MRRVILTLLTFIMALVLAACFAQPAHAKDDTYCQYIGIAETIFQYLPFIAETFDINLDAEQAAVQVFLEADAANFISGLRGAAMEKDSGAVRDYLKSNGLHLLAANLDADDWSRIWTECDRVSPVITSVFYRRVNGEPQGFLVRIAVYLYQRGDITELTANAVVAVLPTLELSDYEEDMAIVWLAEEIAAARNLARDAN
jgi:hypothetical protein